MNKIKKTRNNRFSLIIILTLLFLMFITGCQSSNSNNGINQMDANTMTAEILQVGKADAIVINQNNYTVVIDCGEEDDGSEIVSKLNKLGVDVIDYLIITHFDKDHVGGAAEVISSYQVNNIIEPAYTPDNPDSPEYIAYKEAIEKNNLSVTSLNKDYQFSLGEMSFNVMSANGSSYKKSIDNNNSLVIGLEHEGNSLLFAGDVEKERINEILKTGIGTYDFLKVPHHGRYNASSEAFLNAVKPKDAVITCSEKNPVEAEVIEALDKLKCNIYYTTNGNISVTSTVNGINVSQ